MVMTLLPIKLSFSKQQPVAGCRSVQSRQITPRGLPLLLSSVTRVAAHASNTLCHCCCRRRLMPLQGMQGRRRSSRWLHYHIHHMLGCLLLQ